MPTRNHKLYITEFGAKGDGVTLNTHSFEKAIEIISNYFRNATLVIPKGVFLTAPFNLTSEMTLYLEEGAVLLASNDTTLWDVIEPLPSYGRGRDHNGPRFTSFIHGYNLHDVAIIGENGTIDGQG